MDGASLPPALVFDETDSCEIHPPEQPGESAKASNQVANTRKSRLSLALHRELLEIASSCADANLQSRILRAAREAFLREHQANAELCVMRDAVNNELVDRSANAARVVERYSVLADRAVSNAGEQAMSAVAHERATFAAAAIEDALCSLEVHVLQPSRECARLDGFDLDSERLQAEKTNRKTKPKK